MDSILLKVACLAVVTIVEALSPGNPAMPSIKRNFIDLYSIVKGAN